MGTKKNVAILCPKLTGGGAERIVSTLSSYLEESTNLYLFIFDTSEIVYEYGGNLIDMEFNEIQNSYLKYGKIISKLLRPLIYYKKIKAIKKKKEELNINCSISFLDTPNIFNILSKSTEKLILSVRSTRSVQNSTLMERIENLCIRLLYNKADKIISISEGVKKDLIKNFGINGDLIKTIYNPFNFNLIKEYSKELLDPEYAKLFIEHDVIITVGRLEEAKNQKRLIKEFAYVCKKQPNSRLVIIGSGSLEKELKVIVDNLDLEDFIVFIPFTSNPFKYIAAAKVFAFSSIREGYGNVLIEAMTCGTPVVSTDCLSGPREIIAGESDYDYILYDLKVFDRGILVPLEKNTSSDHALADGILYMLENDELQKRIIKSSLSYINNYSIDKIMKQWTDTIYGI